jgi:hypothetical protein
MINVTSYPENYFIIEESYFYHFRCYVVTCLLQKKLCERYIDRVTPSYSMIYLTSSRLKTIKDEIETRLFAIISCVNGRGIIKDVIG